MLRQYYTGWFGIPGGPESGNTKVHVCEKIETPSLVRFQPVCGAQLSPQMEFQYCAHGVVSQYIECERCKSSTVVAAEMQREIAEWKRRWGDLVRRTR